MKELQFFSKSSVDPAQLQRPYFVYSHRAEDGVYALGYKIDVVRFSQGRLFIDQVEVQSPSFGPRSVTWSEQGEKGFTAGSLQFSLSGVECHGTIALGRSAQEHEILDVFATAMPPSLYQTWITKTRQPEGTTPENVAAEQWIAGLQFEIGYKYQPGDPLPTTSVTLAGQDVSEYVGLNIAKGDLLEVELALLGSVVCGFDASLYLTGSIVFSPFGDDFSGQLTAICRDQAGEGTYLWKGKVLKSELPAIERELPARAPAPEVFLAEASTPTLAELISLIPGEDIARKAHDMLVENMKWAIARDPGEQTWLAEFFGQTPPVLSPGRIALAERGQQWYQQKFSIAYLGWAFDGLTGPAAPVFKLDDRRKKKLQAYLTEGMGKSSDYNEQMNGLYRDAYVQARPRLQAYLDDGGEKWAGALLEAITTPSQLSLMVNRLYAAHDMSAANNFATLLLTLDPGGNTAKLYQERILARVLLKSASQTAVRDEAVTMEWLPDALRIFVETYGTSESRDATSDSGEGPDERRKVADAVREAARQFGSYTSLAQRLAKFLIAVKGSTIAEQNEGAQAAFAREFPGLARAARVLFFITWVGGLFNLIMGFLGFKEMSRVQKIRAITSAVGLVGGLSGELIAIFKPKLTFQDWSQINQAAASNEALEGTADLFEAAVGEDYVQVGMGSVSELFDAEGGFIRAQRWSQFFTFAETFLKVLGVVISAVFAALSTIDFVNDIREGRPTQAVFDGILMAANGLATIAVVIDLFVSTVAFALAAAVFAIIGLIVSIVMSFIPKPKEDEPVNRFMKNTAIPFVDGLPDPTAAAGSAFQLQIV